MATKIALIQFWVEIHKDFEYLSKRVEKHLKLASKEGCSIVSFPEDFWFGPLDYYTPCEAENIISAQTPKILIWFGRMAKKYNLNIIAGSFIEKENDDNFNISTVIDSKGKIIYKYQKQNLLPFGFEKKYVSKGNKNRVMDLDGIKVGIIICRDLFYPELVKKLRLGGAEIVFVPSFWPKRSNDYARHKLINQYGLTEHKLVDALCQARSFENELVVLYVNASGNLKDNNENDVLLGRTQTCLPFYGCTNKLNQNKEGVIIFEYDKEIVLDARKAYQL